MRAGTAVNRRALPPDQGVSGASLRKHQSGRSGPDVNTQLTDPHKLSILTVTSLNTVCTQRIGEATMPQGNSTSAPHPTGIPAGRQPNRAGSIPALCCVAGLILVAVPDCVAQPPEPTPTPRDSNSLLKNPLYKTTMTCSDFLALLKSESRSDAGTAILWLDGFYSGKFGITAFVPGWALTVSQGVGSRCAVQLNWDRPVLDIIADLHRQHSG